MIILLRKRRIKTDKATYFMDGGGVSSIFRIWIQSWRFEIANSYHYNLEYRDESIYLLCGFNVSLLK